VLKNVKPRGTSKPVYGNLYLLTQADAEHLFLTETPAVSPQRLTFTKLREAGPWRQIVKGKARVAEAPTEEQWKDAAVYRIAVDSVDMSALLAITYRGDCARLYAGGRLVADNFYYGRPMFFGLWRLPATVTELELHLLPLQPEAPLYLPREADRRAGEELIKVEKL
jgi:hypothetical protein